MNPKYKKMLKLMQKKEALTSRRQTKDKWFLYILQCRDGSFYTGVTKDLKRRLKMHNDGKASRYTRTRRPVALLYQETCASRTQGLARECAIKSFSRKKKEALLAQQPRTTAKQPRVKRGE